MKCVTPALIVLFKPPLKNSNMKHVLSIHCIAQFWHMHVKPIDVVILSGFTTFIRHLWVNETIIKSISSCDRTA